MKKAFPSIIKLFIDEEKFFGKSLATPFFQKKVPPKKDGFTLLEMMIVMIIMGLITALAYPQYQVVSHSNLRLASRQLAGAIRYLHTRAVLDKKNWRLAIDFDKNRYWGERLEPLVESEEEKSPADDSWAKLENAQTDTYTLTPTAKEVETFNQWQKVNTAVLKETRLPKGVVFLDMRALGRDTVNAGLGYIYFSPYGGVERAVFHLKHEKHDWVYTIVTKPLSGRVAVFDDYRDIELTPITSSVVE